MADELIGVNGAWVSFRGAAVPAIADIDLRIEAGASLGIVGESGSGKTTLARILTGALAPTVGSVLVAGRPWSNVRRTDRERARVQMVFQDPLGSLNPRLSAREAVAEVFEVWHRLDRTVASARAAKLLAETGLHGAVIDRRPRKLSGGQCQRVGIARALACEPDVLVADEPTSSLDVSVQAQILNLLIGLRESRGLALVLISHDLGVIQYVCDYVAVMYQGRVIERGPVEQIFTSPEAEYTRTLISAIPGWRQPNGPGDAIVDPADSRRAV